MVLTTIFGVIGSITAFITFLPPGRVLYKILQGSSTEVFSPIPHHAAFISSVLWVMYGYVHGDIFLVIIHRIGILVKMSQLTLFLLITQSCEKTMKHQIIFFSELSAISLLGVLAHGYDDPDGLAGVVCVLGSLLMYAVKMEYETKRMERVTFFVRLGSFANGAIWTVYGIISSDDFIWFPNLAVALVNLVQLVLHAIHYYRPAQRQIAVETEVVNYGGF